MIQGRCGFGRGLTEESFQLGATLRRCDQLLPALLILPGQQEPCEVGNLRAFAFRQRFTEPNQFLGFRGHDHILAGETQGFQHARKPGVLVRSLAGPPQRA